MIHSPRPPRRDHGARSLGIVRSRRIVVTLCLAISLISIGFLATDLTVSRAVVVELSSARSSDSTTLDPGGPAGRLADGGATRTDRHALASEVTIVGSLSGLDDKYLADVLITVLQRHSAATASAVSSASGSFSIGHIAPTSDMRLRIEGKALASSEVAVDSLIIERTDTTWTISPIAVTASGRIELMIQCEPDVARLMQDYGVSEVVQVNISSQVDTSTAPKEPSSAKRILASKEITVGGRSGAAVESTIVDLGTVAPVTVRWQTAHPHLRHSNSVLAKEQRRQFNLDTLTYDPACLRLETHHLIFGVVTDSQGKRLPGCEIFIHSTVGEQTTWADRSGRFFVVAEDDLARQVFAQYGPHFRSAKVSHVPGHEMQLRVDTLGAAAIRVIAPDGSVAKWCGAAVGNRFRRPLDPMDSLVETEDGVLLMKRKVVAPGTSLYVYGEGFEGVVALSRGLTADDGIVDVRVENELVCNLSVVVQGCEGHAMFVRLKELDQGQLRGRNGRTYSTRGIVGQAKLTLSNIARGTYLGEVLVSGSSTVVGKFIADVNYTDQEVLVTCQTQYTKPWK